MSEIKSSLGKRTFYSVEEPKHFVVNEPDDFESQPTPMSNQEQAHRLMAEREKLLMEARNNQHEQEPPMSLEEIENMRKRKIEAMNKATPAEKKGIELLTSIGRAYKDVKVMDGDNIAVFTIRTLKSKERAPLFELEDTMIRSLKRDVAIEVKHLTLAYCVSAIDGVPIDFILKCSSFKDEEKIKCRKEFFEDLDESITNFLLANYEELKEQNKKRYSLKSPEQVKEAAEALKKSSEGT